MKNRTVFYLALCIIVQRLVLILAFPPVTEPDSIYYMELGRTLASTFGFDSSLRLPGYPALLALCYGLFGPSQLPVVIAQHLLAIALFLTLLSLLPGRKEKIWFTALFFCDQLYASYQHAILAESLFSFLICLSAVEFRNYRVTGKAAHLLLCGALVAAGLFTKPVLKFFPAVVPLLLLAGRDPLRKKLAAAALFLAVPLLTSGLWSWRNQAGAGKFSLLSFESRHYVGRIVNFAEFPENSAIREHFLRNRGGDGVSRKAKPGVIYATIDDLKARGVSDAEMGAEFREIFRLSVLRHPLAYMKDTAVEMFYFFFSAHNLNAKHALKDMLPFSVEDGLRKGRYGQVLLKTTVSLHPFYWALFLLTLLFLAARLGSLPAGLDGFTPYAFALMAYIALVTSMANEGLATYRCPIQPLMLFFSALVLAGRPVAGKDGAADARSPMPAARETGRFDWNDKWKTHKVTAAEAWLIGQRDAILNRCLDGLPPGDKTVIEVGCGAASNLRLLVRNRKDITCYAIDASPEAVARVKGEVPNAVIGDVFSTPFKDGQFDLIYSAGLMEHFPDETPFAKEMRRILKGGGRIVTFVPGRFTLWQLHQILFFTLFSGGYEKSYSYARLRKVFENNGFETESFCGLDPFSLQGAVMRLLGRSFRPLFTKSLFKSAYTELCLISKKAPANNGGLKRTQENI